MYINFIMLALMMGSMATYAMEQDNMDIEERPAKRQKKEISIVPPIPTAPKKKKLSNLERQRMRILLKQNEEQSEEDTELYWVDEWADGYASDNEEEIFDQYSQYRPDIVMRFRLRYEQLEARSSKP